MKGKNEMNLNQEILKAVEEMGFDKSGVVHTRLNSLLQQVK